jgi:flagellar motility protein MotE (MotC chaperone)
MIKLRTSFFALFFIFLLLSIKISHIITNVHSKNVLSIGHEAQADDPPIIENSKNTEEKQPLKENLSSDKTENNLLSSKTSTPFDLLELSPSEVEILQNLLERKNALDTQEKLLGKKEQMIQLAHQQLDKKIEELKSLRTTIETLLNTYNDKDKQNLKNIAHIYDSMPPEKAAAILAGLNNDQLIDIISLMKKSPAVIAAMPPEKAKNITALLMESKKINSSNLSKK